MIAGRGSLAAGSLVLACAMAPAAVSRAQTAPSATLPSPSEAEERPRQPRTLGVDELVGLLDAQQHRLDAAEALIRQQAAALAEQKATLQTQQATLDRLMSAQDLGAVRASGPAAGPGAPRPMDVALAPAAPAAPTVPGGAPAPPPTSPSVQPVGPVGEAPAPEPLRQVALPQFVSVLTPPGHLTLDAGVSYEQTSSNRLVYRGVEIVPGVQIGLVEANNANRNSAVATAIARYGIWPRFEIEVLAPYVYRSDRVEMLSQRDQSISQAQQLHGSGLGDVEVTGRYQLTGGANGWPILIANLRFKSDTGKGPFDVAYDQYGVATNLALGSGFLGVEPSVSAIYTTDPVVLFANVSYLVNLSRDIDKTIDGALVGRVEPGDSVGASAGFAFSVNPRFSFTLGYKHNFIDRTRTELGGTWQKSTSLQIGSLLFGWAFRFSDRVSLISNAEVGATGDAPNIVLSFRVPYTF